MAGTASLVATMLVTLGTLPQLSYSSDASSGMVTTTCGQNIVIMADGDYAQIRVNLTLGQAQPAGVSCSWVIPAHNSSMSNQVFLTSDVNLALGCTKNVFTASEMDPATNVLNTLPLKCAGWGSNGSDFNSPVMTQPGFSMVVSLNTSSALTENFFLMFIIPFVWTDDVCPRNQRKTIIAQPGTSESEMVQLTVNGLISRLPNNLVCKWEFQSPDEGVVKLELRTLGYNVWDESGKCEEGDHFFVSDVENSTTPDKVPLCKDPGIGFDFTSTTGLAFVTFQSDNSGGAYQYFFIRYWSVQSCPSTLPVLEAVFEEEQFIKGTSYHQLGAGQEELCSWTATARRSNNVIKIIRLDAHEFQEDCDGMKDYLMLNGRNVSMCDTDSDEFPVWSEGRSMEIEFHSITQTTRRSFMLHYMAVQKGPCQGYPKRMTIEAKLAWTWMFESLRPIPHGDVSNGLVCQWLFTAKDEGYVIQVKVDQAKSDSDKYGVNFNPASCSFQYFHIYSGSAANSTAELSATCSMDRSSIIYTSTSKDMLFVYNRVSGEDSGFLMKVKQVRDPATSGAQKAHAVLGCLGTILVVVVAFRS